MKILKYTILSAAILLSGCGKGFLEVESIGQLGKEQLFTDVNGVRDALYGSYSLTAKFIQSEYGIYGDLRGEDVIRLTTSGDIYMLDEFNYTYNQDNATGPTTAIWADGYEALNNINNVIEGSEALKAGRLNNAELVALEKYQGEAKALRATVFLALCNVYAQHYTYTADASHLGIPLPLKTPPPGGKLARATVKETYAQIISDLKASISALDGQTSQRIYASADAARGLLSRVYLYMGDYENAILYANEIINSGKNNLVKADEYLDMFILSSQRFDFNTIKSEVLWQMNLTNLSSRYMSLFYCGANFLGVANESYVNMFENSDVRKSMFYNDNGKFMTLKYDAYAGVVDANWPINFKVIRTAEVILNRAESYFHQQKYDLALADLKTIRARAYDVNASEIVINYNSPAELLTLIKNERRKELGFEGQRIYDITRYKESLNRGGNCTSSTCAVSYPNDIFIMPIPKTELDANDLIIPNPTVNN